MTNITITINTGAAPPLPSKLRAPKVDWCPFGDMKPGDSCLILGRDPNSLYSSVQDYKRKSAYDFVTSKQEGGLRVWCIERSTRPAPNDVVVILNQAPHHEV